MTENSGQDDSGSMHLLQHPWFAVKGVLRPSCLALVHAINDDSEDIETCPAGPSKAPIDEAIMVLSPATSEQVPSSQLGTSSFLGWTPGRHGNHCTLCAAISS